MKAYSLYLLIHKGKGLRFAFTFLNECRSLSQFTECYMVFHGMQNGHYFVLHDDDDDDLFKLE
jgi:hypothetical protein